MMKFEPGDRVVIPAQKSATFPGLVYPSRAGEVKVVFEEDSIFYAELLLDDGTHIISAPLDELQRESN